MKKPYFRIATIALVCGSMTLTSCIGSFRLTNSVLTWNNQVGSKFVNELVFFAFWILPVYEVTSLADLLVINSIEFWSGRNPIAQGTRAIDTDHGRYLVACDGKGYTITCPNGQDMRLDFNADTRTWSFNDNGTLYPFMTIVDDSHVKMITPEGDFRMVDLTEEGVMAYRQAVTASLPQLITAAL